jgi:hypothetical protein
MRLAAVDRHAHRANLRIISGIMRMKAQPPTPMEIRRIAVADPTRRAMSVYHPRCICGGGFRE